jgi:hypothetical protein
MSTGCSKMRKADCVTKTGCKWEKRCVSESKPAKKAPSPKTSPKSKSKSTTTSPKAKKPASFLTHSELQQLGQHINSKLKFSVSFFTEAKQAVFAICEYILRSKTIKKYTASKIEKQIVSKRWDDISFVVQTIMIRIYMENKKGVNNCPKTFATAFKNNFPALEIDELGLASLHALLKYFVGEFMDIVTPKTPGKASGEDLRNALAKDKELSTLLKAAHKQKK